MDGARSEVCFCCQRKGGKGIVIAGRFLCRACERDLAGAEPGSPEYERYMERCKAIWAAFKH